jgi:hypothetical protein
MSRSTPNSVYPLATRQGAAIPLDVAMPIEGGLIDLTAGDSVFTYTLPPGITLVSVMTEEYAVLQVFSIADPSIELQFFLAPGVLYDLALPTLLGGSEVRIQGTFTVATRGVFNIIQRWAQLDNQNFEVS